jgi:hypothetical protein
MLSDAAFPHARGVDNAPLAAESVLVVRLATKPSTACHCGLGNDSLPPSILEKGKPAARLGRKAKGRSHLGGCGSRVAEGMMAPIASDHPMRVDPRKGRRCC